MNLKRLFTSLLSAAAISGAVFAGEPVKSCDRLPMSMYRRSISRRARAVQEPRWGASG